MPALPALILGAVLIGLVPAGVRLSADWGGLGPLATAMWRFALSAPLLLLASRWRGGATPARSGLLLAAGLLFVADIACFFISIARCGGALATLLSNCAPLAVLALAPWLLRQRVPRGAWVGAGLAVLGVLGLLSPGREAADTLGVGLGLLSAVFYGGYQLAVVGLRRDQPVLRILASVSVIGALVLAPVAWLVEERLLPNSGAGWAVLLGLALVTQIGGQGLIAWAMAGLPAAFGSVVLLVQPLVATVIGWLAFHEQLSAMQWIGATVLLAALWWVRAATTEPPSSPSGCTPDPATGPR